MHLAEQVVRAGSDLPPGAEVTLSYLDQNLLAPLAERRAELAETYGFECACSRYCVCVFGGGGGHTLWYRAATAAPPVLQPSCPPPPCRCSAEASAEGGAAAAAAEAAAAYVARPEVDALLQAAADGEEVLEAAELRQVRGNSGGRGVGRVSQASGPYQGQG